MVLLFKLLLAHFIGDFILQPTAWVRAKEEKKLRAWQLYIHTLVHAALIMLLLWDWSFLKWAALIAFLHFIIDGAKLMLQKEENKRGYFFTDQVLHIFSILAVYLLYQNKSLTFLVPDLDEGFWLLITLVLFNTFPAAIVIRNLLMHWTRQIENLEDESLQQAGKYIGILERLFVFVFMVTGHLETVGFLIAAKSIFRFGDLTRAKDRKLTEYILIGTLISFGMAILSGLLYLRYLN